MITEEQLQKWSEWASGFLAMDEDDYEPCEGTGWDEWLEETEGVYVHKEFHLATVAVLELIAEVRRLRKQESDRLREENKQRFGTRSGL